MSNPYNINGSVADAMDYSKLISTTKSNNAGISSLLPSSNKYTSVFNSPKYTGTQTNSSYLWDDKYAAKQADIQKGVNGYLHDNDPGVINPYKKNWATDNADDTNTTKTPGTDWIGGIAALGTAGAQWMGVLAQKDMNKAIISDNNRKFNLMKNQYNDQKKVRAHNSAALG